MKENIFYSKEFTAKINMRTHSIAWFRIEMKCKWKMPRRFLVEWWLRNILVAGVGR